MRSQAQRRRIDSDRFIDGPQNPHVREAARLYQRRERDRRGLLIAEGTWALRTALDGGARVREVFFCTQYFRDGEPALLVRARETGAGLTELSQRALERLSSRDGPDAIVSVVARSSVRLQDVAATDRWLVCVAERIEKPGNLGAIIRTACAAGADLVIACDAQTDIHGPAVVRASLGALFLVPVVTSPMDEALRWMRNQSITIYATTPQAFVDPWTVDLRASSAIVIGNEHRGLSARWLDVADDRIRIPMHGPMNSLNASTAAGIVLFEAVRQRSANGYARQSL